MKTGCYDISEGWVGTAKGIEYGLGDIQGMAVVVISGIDRTGHLKPGGGFVFCQVHDFLANVPPQSIGAM